MQNPSAVLVSRFVAEVALATVTAAIGAVVTLGALEFGTGWGDVVAFVLLILILMFRPTGILGESLGRARV